MHESKEDLLEQTYALVVENNKLLKKMRAGARWGFLFKLLFWILMLGVPIWLYFNLLQPIIQQSLDALQQVQGAVGQAQDLSNNINLQGVDIQRLLKSIPNLGTLKQ